MNWEAIGAAGELLGSVAVLVTLVYLAVQVGHAKEQMARGARGARYEALRQLYTLSSSQELMSAHLSMNGRLGVEPTAWTRFVLECGGTREEAHLLNMQEWFRWSLVEQTLTSASELRPAERIQAETSYRALYGGKGVSANWFRIVARPALNADVVRYIDDLLEQPDRAPGLIG